MQIALERDRAGELAEKEAVLRNKIATLRKQMGGFNAAREGDVQVQL